MPNRSQENLKVPFTSLYAPYDRKPQHPLLRMIMPLTFLPFMLLIVPILEISLFIVIGGRIGAVWTIGLVLFTAILGSILLRHEGLKTFATIQSKMNAGEIPGEELVKGVMILIAGVLLLTPGFLTDSIGFALFVPGVRKIIWGALASRFKFHQSGYQAGAGYQAGEGGPAGFNGNRQDHTEPGVVELDPDDFHVKPDSESP